MQYHPFRKLYSKEMLSSALLLLICISCSTTNRFDQGSVNPGVFYTKTTFITVKSVVVLECELNGVSKNFLFDTGAQLSSVQRDTISGETITVRGGSNRTVISGTETIRSFKIGDVEFIDTFATNENVPYLKENIPNYGGVIGRTIIDKANWLIDYPNRTIELSDRDLSDEGFSDIPLLGESGAHYTEVEIDQMKYRSILDLGSTSVFNIPEDTELAKRLLDRYPFTENIRERYTVGGVETITELIGNIPELRIGDIIFENIRVNINSSSQIRIGMPFFEDHQIYIDNQNNRYRIKRS